MTENEPGTGAQAIISLYARHIRQIKCFLHSGIRCRDSTVAEKVIIATGTK